MSEENQNPTILAVDDEPQVLSSIETLLRRAGYEVTTSESGSDALDLLETLTPDLILLDIAMPEMDGYEVCHRIRAREALAEVPVVFVTAMTGDRDKQRAFAVGGSGYIQKPFEQTAFLTAVRGFLDGTYTMVVLPGAEESDGGEPRGLHDLPPFTEFAEWLLDDLPQESTQGLLAPKDPQSLYEWGEMAGLDGAKLARRIAEYTGLPFLHRVDPDDLELGMLPRRFSLSKLVLPVRSRQDNPGLILSNPYDWRLREDLEHTRFRDLKPEVLIAAPEAIRSVFEYSGKGGGTSVPVDGPEDGPGGSSDPSLIWLSRSAARAEAVEAAEVAVRDEEEDDQGGLDRDPGRDHPVARLAEAVLSTAVKERASDIHIEPKPEMTMIRGRVDGDMVELEEIPSQVSGMLISRFKALAGMDIAEKRKPQDGGMEKKIQGRPFKLRLATTSTPHGESLVIRLLEPTADPRTLQELGMMPDQEAAVRDLADRGQGLILLVGPTGSGKSTTIYSLLSGVDTRRRSLMSVEDPVEYRIAFANQQQVNEVAGVTFESLLKSAVRQDPDILLLGEIRDLFSAKAAMDFASSGHLTITTMHSSNSTTAIFRLERLGASRVDMSEALIGVVAQKLIKTLCEECKRVRPVTDEEREILAPYTSEIPEEVAEPVGCDACRGTGYFGRQGLFEILRFDAAMAERVREGMPISDIRKFARQRGDFFISDHGIEKIRQLVAPVKDVFEKVLAEETVSVQAISDSGREGGDAAEAKARETVLGPEESEPVQAKAREEARRPEGEGAPLPEAPAGPGKILVVDDDEDIRVLLERYLEGAGFHVVLAEDGVKALLELGKSDIDLILSDINMPNLDGLKLIEIAKQHGTSAPVVFLSAEDDPAVELRGLELGAADFIRKPIRKDVLLHRIRRALKDKEYPWTRKTKSWSPWTRT